MRLGENEYTTRFSGLQGNPNYYTLDIVAALSAIIVLVYYKKEKTVLLAICLIALSVFGLMSVSKSFLLTWILLLVCWFVLSIRQGFGKLFGSILVVTIGAMIVYYFAYDYINAFLFRFAADNSGTLDSITTGRTELWSLYLDEIFNNIRILLFGNGLNTMIETLGKGAHNTYLEALFNLGIVGSTILIISICICMNRVKFKGVVWIPVMMLMIRMFAIGILTYDNLWFYISIPLMLACDHQKERAKNQTSIVRQLCSHEGFSL